MGRKGSAAPPHKKPRAKSPVQYFVKVKYNDQLYPTLDKHKKVLDFLDWIKTEGPRELAKVRVSDLKFFTSESGEGRRQCQWEDILAEIAEGGTRAQPWYVDYDEPPEVAQRTIELGELDLDHCVHPKHYLPPANFVDVNTCVGSCFNVIEEQLPLTSRVPPLMLSSCMRSGKTTALYVLFDVLRQKEYSPIYISFNGSPKTVPLEGERALDALVSKIATALLKVEPETRQPETRVEADALRCEKHTLQTFLTRCSSSNRKVVLLVDELNILLKVKDPEAYQHVGSFLRSLLDGQGTYLVFTTHVPESAGIDALLGKGTGSDRDLRVVHLPIAPSLEDLRGMSTECVSLTASEAALYSMLPALMYSVKNPKLDFSLRTRFNSLAPHPDCTPALVKHFLDEFFSGEYDSNNKDLRHFDQLTWSPAKEEVRWVLAYVGMMCSYLELHSVADLVKSLKNDVKRTQTGFDLEVASQIAIALRCEQAKHGGLQHRLLPGPPGAPRPQHVYHHVIPSDYVDHRGALDWWIGGQKEPVQQYPYFAVLCPQNAKFADFDTIVVYAATAHGSLYVHGFQNKLTKDYPDKDAPFATKGILLRGDAPRSPAGSKKRVGWEYLSKADIIGFLGKSLESVYPSSWPK